MAAQTSEQQKVVKTILRVARQHNASPKEIKAALETGIVESGLTNPSGGDADSAGWRQERASLYPDPTNVAAAAARFFTEARQANRTGQYGSAGSLAAAVQRPAAQYRGRYQQQAGAADSLLASYGGGNPSVAPGQVNVPGSTVTTTTPGVDNSGMRRQLVADFLSQGGVKNSAATASFASGIRGAQDVPGSTRTVKSNVRLDPATATVSGKGVQAVTARADKLDAEKRPYLYGGGHAGDSWSLDCSAAVAAALGVDVRTSGEFEKFGQPGKGKNVTIYANDGHVLMEVNGHFWGTSQSNPDGGPGWIKRADIPASYLKNFTARHPDGQ